MKIRLMAAVLAVFLLIPLNLTAFANGIDSGAAIPQTTPEDEIIDITIIEEEASPDAVTTIKVTGDTVEVGAEDSAAAQVLTPAGAGTVIDSTKNPDGKEFFTIMTPDENVFYLVIDRQRETDNVYFLNDVTEADLLPLTKTQISDPEPVEEPVTPEPEPEPAPKKSGGSIFMIILLAILGGGAYWYFKIYRPKQQQNNNTDFDEEDYSDEPDPYMESDYDGGDWDSEEDDRTGGNGA
jgi:hypothetical protein